MAVTTYSQWLADGSPWKPAAPVNSVAQKLRGYGYTVYILGDHHHLTANPPEDHTPYSHTPWPGSQPYPFVLAEDIMPGGVWPLDRLGAKIYADKQAGHPGLAGLKYMNWTDSSGNCWHDKWEPNHQRSNSSDTGHIHLSWRTDFVNKPTTYDPIGGNPMAINQDMLDSLGAFFGTPALTKNDDGTYNSGGGHSVWWQSIDGTMAWVRLKNIDDAVSALPAEIATQVLAQLKGKPIPDIVAALKVIFGPDSTAIGAGLLG